MLCNCGREVGWKGRKEGRKEGRKGERGEARLAPTRERAKRGPKGAIREERSDGMSRFYTHEVGQNIPRRARQNREGGMHLSFIPRKRTFLSILLLLLSTDQNWHSFVSLSFSRLVFFFNATVLFHIFPSLSPLHLSSSFSCCSCSP